VSALDTDTLSEIIKGKNATITAKASAYVSAHGRLTTSTVSVAEIVHGLRRMGRAFGFASGEVHVPERGLQVLVSGEALDAERWRASHREWLQNARGFPAPLARKPFAGGAGERRGRLGGALTTRTPEQAPVRGMLRGRRSHHRGL
jgi:predicted nucleic acid-binding protein